MLSTANGMQRLSGATDARDLTRAIRAAADDPSVREVVLNIDSPGGDVLAVDAPTAAIAYARDRKRVTATTQGLMASTAYWLASQADRIVASPNAQVGSIGVIYTHQGWSARWEREGVKVTHLRSGPKTALASNAEPFSDDRRRTADPASARTSRPEWSIHQNRCAPVPPVRGCSMVPR